MGALTDPGSVTLSGTCYRFVSPTYVPYFAGSVALTNVQTSQYFVLQSLGK